MERASERERERAGERGKVTDACVEWLVESGKCVCPVQAQAQQFQQSLPIGPDA